MEIVQPKIQCPEDLDFDPDTSSVALAPRQALIWTLVELYRTLGFQDIRARVPGIPAPAIIGGLLESHRPDITCRLGKTWFLCDTLPSAEMGWGDLQCRFELFASVAEEWPGQFHLACEESTSTFSTPEMLGRELRRAHVTPSRVWYL